MVERASELTHVNMFNDWRQLNAYWHNYGEWAREKRVDCAAFCHLDLYNNIMRVKIALAAMPTHTCDKFVISCVEIRLSISVVVLLLCLPFSVVRFPSSLLSLNSCLP